jgi:triacylglycerol esterase/lipase EstA (alpha/beta hydrolase family)
MLKKKSNGNFHKWLTQQVLGLYDDEDSKHVYLQRSFQNPADAPSHNAYEVGYAAWQGDNVCADRRSLIEEAQVVHAGGLDSLKLKRTEKKDYRKIPSRNILLAHSMGGVAIREYVQNQNIYKNDVDKLIRIFHLS